MGRLRHRTDRHTRRRPCSGHSGGPPATDPLSARLGPPRPPAAQHIHLDLLQRQLRAAEDLCSDHAAGAAIAMPRELHCPSDGGEGGLPALRVISQPTALRPSEELLPLPLCVVSCQDAEPARTASKFRDEPDGPVSAVGQQGQRAAPRAPKSRARRTRPLSSSAMGKHSNSRSPGVRPSKFLTRTPPESDKQTPKGFP